MDIDEISKKLISDRDIKFNSQILCSLDNSYQKIVFEYLKLKYNFKGIDLVDCIRAVSFDHIIQGDSQKVDRFAFNLASIYHYYNSNHSILDIQTMIEGCICINNKRGLITASQFINSFDHTEYDKEFIGEIFHLVHNNPIEFNIKDSIQHILVGAHIKIQSGSYNWFSSRRKNCEDIKYAIIYDKCINIYKKDSVPSQLMLNELYVLICKKYVPDSKILLKGVYAVIGFNRNGKTCDIYNSKNSLIWSIEVITGSAEELVDEINLTGALLSADIEFKSSSTVSEKDKKYALDAIELQSKELSEHISDIEVINDPQQSHYNTLGPMVSRKMSTIQQEPKRKNSIAKNFYKNVKRKLSRTTNRPKQPIDLIVPANSTQFNTFTKAEEVLNMEIGERGDEDGVNKCDFSKFKIKSNSLSELYIKVPKQYDLYYTALYQNLSSLSKQK